MLDPDAVEKLPWRLRRVIRHPWNRAWRLALTPRARRRLRRFLNEHGHVTPHFKWSETTSGDGKEVPAELRRNAIRHAWNLERFRHRLGGPPISFHSWYRSPAHNRKVGGASQSKHMEALATDLVMPLRKDGKVIPRERVMEVADSVWASGGVGDYPSGAVHVDSRGVRARWSSF